jgi:hypothetical protein
LPQRRDCQQTIGSHVSIREATDLKSSTPRNGDTEPGAGVRPGRDRVIPKGTALAISIAFKVAASLLDRFLKARGELMVDPVETIRSLAQERKMSQKFADEVTSSCSAEPEPTRFGVINAFTRAAQKLGPLERVEMERFAGTLLEAQL